VSSLAWLFVLPDALGQARGAHTKGSHSSVSRWNLDLSKSLDAGITIVSHGCVAKFPNGDSALRLERRERATRSGCASFCRDAHHGCFGFRGPEMLISRLA